MDDLVSFFCSAIAVGELVSSYYASTRISRWVSARSPLYLCHRVVLQDITVGYVHYIAASFVTIAG